jgi:hypothetical protein|tara:strand:+ start:61 stop:627 length:567 start_codon:yes stop_codon:yes gene_type:complete
MVLKTICPPALIYLVFSITQVAIDTMRGMYNLAFIKIWVALVFTILLNYLCLSGLGVISWLIVFIPFILMTIIVSMLLIMFGLDPATGKIRKSKKNVLTPKDNRAIALAERLAKKYDMDEPTRHGNVNKKYDMDEPTGPTGPANVNKKYDTRETTYGKSKISHNEKKVLNDMVQKRTGLARDPLLINK